MNVKFTGEFFVPDDSGDRIHADHMARYVFSKQYARDKHTLDIACGYGYGGPILKDAGAKSYIGIDVNTELVENAKKIYNNKDLHYMVGDIRNFRPANPVDLIICFETIEHIFFYKEALQNLFNVLKPGGQMLISSPNRPVSSPNSKLITDKPLNKFHTQEFTMDELMQELIDVGFKCDKSNIFGQRTSRLYFSNKYLRFISKKLYDPASRSNACPEKIRHGQPRYFIIEANKPL